MSTTKLATQIVAPTGSATQSAIAALRASRSTDLCGLLRALAHTLGPSMKPKGSGWSRRRCAGKSVAAEAQTMSCRRRATQDAGASCNASRLFFWIFRFTSRVEGRATISNIRDGRTAQVWIARFAVVFVSAVDAIGASASALTLVPERTNLQILEFVRQLRSPGDTPMVRSRPPRHADQVVETAQSDGAAARSMVAASWRRSLLSHGLEPDSERQAQQLTEAELREAREAIDPLLAVAQPTLDRLFQSVGGAGCCVVLTDTNGVIVDRRSSESDDTIFSRWGLSDGAVWSEALEGTNGIGTCLAEKRAVAIHRDEHFYSRNTDMSCMDAPIFDHEGKLAAALDVSSCREDHTERVAALVSAVVADAAKRIETDYFRAAFRDARVVIVGSKVGNSGQMLLAVDQDDLVIGASRAARRAYGLSDDSFRSPRPAADLLSGRELKADLDAAERGEVQRALARAEGNISATAIALGIGRATLYRRMKRLGLSRN